MRLTLKQKLARRKMEINALLPTIRQLVRIGANAFVSKCAAKSKIGLPREFGSMLAVGVEE